MTGFLSYVLIAAEIMSGLALVAAALVNKQAHPYWRYTALVMFVVAAMGAVLIGVMFHKRGILRWLHDLCFDNSWETTLRYAFYLRFQLLISCAFFLFPPLAVFRLRRLMDSLFYVNPHELFYITWMAVLTAWSLMVSFQLTCIHGPVRFGGDPLRIRDWLRVNGRPWKEECFSPLLASPTVGFCLVCSQQWVGGAIAVVCGLTAAWLTLFITTWQRETIVPSCVAPSTLLLDGYKYRPRWRASMASEPPAAGILTEMLLRLLGPGYYDAERQHPLPGHMLAATLMVLVMCTYGLLGFAFRPAGGWNDYFPSLGYVMITFMLAAWGFPAAAFFFDRWRVPVTFAVVSALVLYSLSETDHYYLTKPVTTELIAAAPSLTPSQALQRWMETRPNNDQMTLVVVSGGGIASATWGAEVLTGLEEKIGTPFLESLHAMSSASGGSVAVMYYLDGFSSTVPRDLMQLRHIREAASRSSLRAMSWGVAYPDLWRFLAPPILKCAPYLDRGWALQETWRQELVKPEMSLWGWRGRIARGEMPIPLLDATAVESGRQFLLTPIDVRGPGTGQRFRSHHSFLNLYDGRDLDVVTAARLSATFPYVSPISRPSKDSGGPDLHIADGAYLDNYGMATMVEWLNAVLPDYTRTHPRPRLLLIRISIREPNFVDDTVYPSQQGWAYTTYGPLWALMNASQSSQIARNEQLFDLLRDRWTGSSLDGIDLHVANFVLKTEAPLSWQLTDAARQKIHQRWTEEEAHGEGLAEVQRFFAAAPKGILASGQKASSHE